MSHKLSTIGAASGVTFQPLPGKTGKVSRTAEKISGALNALSRAALLGVALTGKGPMQKRAAEVFRAEAVTLGDYLQAAADGVTIDGSRWGEFRALIAATLGAGHLTAARGRDGCAELCRVARLTAERRYLMAETVKQQDSALKTIDTIDTISEAVRTLAERHEAARIAAEAAAQPDAGRVNADAEPMAA